MNKLKEWVKTVAEIKERKPVKTAAHNRLATEIIIEVDETGEEYEVEREVTDNPTLGFDIVKIKDIHKLCEMGCGKIVTNQVIEKKFSFTPEKHWRTRCQNCGAYKHPGEDKLITESHKISAEFNRYFRDKNK